MFFFWAYLVSFICPRLPHSDLSWMASAPEIKKRNLPSAKSSRKNAFITESKSARTCCLFEEVLPPCPAAITMPYLPDDDFLHSNATVLSSSSLHFSKTLTSASKLEAHSSCTVVPCHARTHSGWTVTNPVSGSQPKSIALIVVVVVVMDVVVLVMLVVVDETVVVVMVIVVMVVVVMVVGSAVVVVVVLAAVDVVVCDVNLTIKSTTSTFIKCNDLALGECHAWYVHTYRR